MMTDGAKVIVGLAEAVESLRAELMTAVEAGKDRPMQFSVEPIELITQVAVTKDANGKIGWHLLGVGASYESANTQTLTLKLAPVWKKPDGTLNRDFTIASTGAAGDVIGPHS
jgi:Trypsin-co-occurring domain 2